MNSAENKKKAMLKRLASRNEERILKSINQNQANKIDLRATEQAFLATSPSSINMKTPVKPNVTISEESTSSHNLSFDEKADKQMAALATWSNTMIGLDTSEELDLGATAAEACRRIQKMLSKQADASPADSQSLQSAARRRYQRIFEKNDSGKIKKQCRKLLEDSGMEQSISDLLSKKYIAIKKEIAVYSDLSLQTKLLGTFLCFHPAWLKAALEAIFNAKISVEPKYMIRALSQFFIERVFSNPTMLKNKKFAQGSGVPIVTESGKEALHNHFLEAAMKLLFLIETAYNHHVIPNLTRIFTKSSHFKSMNEIFSELTRELLTGSSADFKKAFARIGFQPTYKQLFFENYNYQAKGFEDFSDGLILAKLVETVGEMPYGQLLLKLRDPAGDRIRKVNNVKVVLEDMAAIGIDAEDVTAGAIVGGKKEAILTTLWAIVGVRMAKEKRVRFSRKTYITSEDFTTPKKSRRSGGQEDMSSDVLKDLKVIGRDLEMEVLDLDSLLDGLLLDKMWTTYAPNGTPIESYPGDDLWGKVVSMAESELAIPRGLDQNVVLFVRMYLERVQLVQMYNEKAVKIQKTWRTYLERKNTPKMYHIVQQVLHENRNSRSLSPPSTSHLAGNETFTVQIYFAKNLYEVIEEEEIQERLEHTSKKAELPDETAFTEKEPELLEESDETMVFSSLLILFRVGHDQKVVFHQEPESGVITIQTSSEDLDNENAAKIQKTWKTYLERKNTPKMYHIVQKVLHENLNSRSLYPLSTSHPTGNATFTAQIYFAKNLYEIVEVELPMEKSEERVVFSTLKRRLRAGHSQEAVTDEEKENEFITIKKSSENVSIGKEDQKENSEVLNSKDQKSLEEEEEVRTVERADGSGDEELQKYLEEIHVEQQESKNYQDSEDVEMLDVFEDVEEKEQKNEVVEPQQTESKRSEFSDGTAENVERQDVIRIISKEDRTLISTPRSTVSSPLPVFVNSTQPNSSESISSTIFQLLEDQKKTNDFLKTMIENQVRFVKQNNLDVTTTDLKNVTSTPELQKILQETKLLKQRQKEVFQAKQLLAIEKRALAVKSVNVSDDDDAIIFRCSEIPEEHLEKLSKSVDFMSIIVEIERKNEETARILTRTREKQGTTAEKELKSVVIIQKFVRGFLVRRRFRLEILNWRERMIAYNQVLAFENEQFDRDEMKDSSVERKLRNSTLNGLTNDNLHIVHIAATIIDRITDLVPKLLEKFVVELNGIKLIYDILAVADQGFAYTAILHPLLRVLQKCFHLVPEDMTNDTIHPLLPKLTPRLFLLMLKHANNRDFFIPIITTLISIGRRFPSQKDSYIGKWDNQIKQTMRKVTDQEGSNHLITLRNICDHLL